MNNNDQAANELKERLVNHIADLRAFADLPPESRTEILDVVAEQTQNYKDAPFIFANTLEYWTRLESINRIPETMNSEEGHRRQPINAGSYEKQINHMSKVDGAVFGDITVRAAQSAVFISLGHAGRFSNSSVLIARTITGDDLLIDLPFEIGERIAHHGSAAFLRGADGSTANRLHFNDFIIKHFGADAAEAILSFFFDTPTYLFHACGSSRELLEKLDDIALSDDIIETPEEK